MSVQAVLLPLFVQAFLIFSLLFWLGATRSRSIRERTVDLKQAAVDTNAWSAKANLINSNFLNQFQLPVLFFVLVLVALATQKADFIFVVLSWVFVISRIVQAVAHTTTNDLRHRGLAFGVGAIALFVMWVIVALRIFLVF